MKLTNEQPAAEPPKHDEFSTQRFRNRRVGLGDAVVPLRQTEPFASYRFGRFAASLGG